jgi:2-iminoacetate synthase ThiH
MADLDKEVKRIEEGDAWDESDEVVQIEVKRPLDKVIPIRISGDKWEEIRQEAKELGIGPTTLARMWIIEHLRQRVKV